MIKTFLVMICFLFFSCSLKNKLHYGKYESRFKGISSFYSIEISKNGTFNFKYHDCIIQDSISGTWILKNKKLLLSNNEMRPQLIEVNEIGGIEGDSLRVHVIGNNKENVYGAFVQINDSFSGYTDDKGHISFNTPQCYKISVNSISSDTGTYYPKNPNIKKLEVKFNTEFYGNSFYFYKTPILFKRKWIYLPINNFKIKLQFNKLK